MSCDYHPLRGDDGELFDGVSVIVNLFKIDVDTKKLMFVKPIMKPVPLTQFVDQVSLQELYRLENRNPL